uniref:Uncharacterized protein n=1 Tax=Ditylenchus dipsaci TaxID=166011 RepID=A0A915DGQ1_9BILA
MSFNANNLIYALFWGMLLGVWAVVLGATVIYFSMKYDQWKDEKQVITLCYDYAKKQRQSDYNKLLAASQAMQNAAKSKMLENARAELKARKADRIAKETKEARLAEKDNKENHKKTKVPKAVRKVSVDVLVQSTYQDSDKSDKKKKGIRNTVSQVTEDPSVSQAPSISQEPAIASKQTLFQPKQAANNKISMTSEATNITENNTVTVDLQ